MSPLRGWALPLRIARRDALRHKARSVLALVMITLPVLAVTTADVLMQTSSVSGPESVDRRMGSAAALVQVNDGVARVDQGPDPDVQFPYTYGKEGAVAPSAEQVSSVLGGARLLDLQHSEAQVATRDGRTQADVTEVDLSDPITAGLFRLTSGRYPSAAGQVVINQALADEGYAVGQTLDLTGDDAPADPLIVGIAESTSIRTFPVAAGPIGSLVPTETQSASWLVAGGPVSWTSVRALNKIGATVSSRAVIDDPPPPSQWPASIYSGGGLSSETVSVLVLIVVMALIEVVLLAGPSFAVGARKQQRSLALLVASGGTPAQSRRVVIGSAIVLGSVAAVVGVVGGIVLAIAGEPVLQHYSDTWFGPLDVPWLHLLGIAAFSLVSAFLAAVVPAWIASRQDVVAVLAGRRGDRAPSLRSPLLGVVLLGVGIVGSAMGARQGGGETLIAASAIPSVLGMVLLVPVVLAGLARVSGRLPLVLRYAVRDAARHRTRTVPAVAAVAATVAGVVALGVGVTSDAAENRATYTASLPAGVGLVSASGDPLDWSAVPALVERAVPGATVTEVSGIDDSSGMDASTYAYTQLRAGRVTPLSQSGSIGSASIGVSDDRLPDSLVGVRGPERRAGEAALREGRVVAFYDGSKPTRSDVRIVRQVSDGATGKVVSTQQATAPVTWLQVGANWSGPSGFVPSAVAQSLGVTPTTVAAVVAGATISKAAQKTVAEGLAAMSQFSGFYVERGYQADSATIIAQLILIGLGAVLMLGGTLTATFLALSDARPDLATLSAVGASPRTRRGVAAAYAVVVGLVGAVLGAAVGFIPGIAVTYPLTSNAGASCATAPGSNGECVTVGPFLDVPWLMVLGLVVALPLLTALVVGAASRSRLPLVARLD